jgi:hypothetical protein
MRREYGKKVTKEMLDSAAWLMVFTTVPRRKLHTEQVLDAYRLRWQIELEIKRDKSIGDLDKLPNFLPETIQTYLYFKLILQQIEHKLISGKVAVSPSVLRTDVAVDDPSEDAQADGTRGHRSLARAYARPRGSPSRTDARAAA